jgi:DnaJ-class molecular chaperone
MNDCNSKDDPRFLPFKCPNCNGYGTVSYGKHICKVCDGKGLVVIDQKTGLQVNDDDGEAENDKRDTRS